MSCPNHPTSTAAFISGCGCKADGAKVIKCQRHADDLHVERGRELVVRPMRSQHRATATRQARTIGLAAAALLSLGIAGASCHPASSHHAPTVTTFSRDCRLGPSDCGYADNGHNSDH